MNPDPPSAAALSRQIIARCGELGFALAGVCPASPPTTHDAFAHWLRDGLHGDMDYLQRHADLRADPQTLLPGVRSVIMVADAYASRNDPPDPSLPPGHGKIARYARGRDYHVVMKNRLHALCDELRVAHPGEAFRAFVDTAPILEREFAARAGLGWFGKNTLLIHPRAGSYLLLGGVLTTLDLPEPEGQTPSPDRCGTCTRCIDACPTRAITPRRIDATRCISYLTIERRGPIDDGLAEALSGWLFGCDICQEVCPHNSPREAPTETAHRPHPAYAPARATLPLLEVLGWTAADRARELSGSSMKRATLSMLRRTAAHLLAGVPQARAELERVARDDADAMVAEAARRALARSER